MTVAAAQVLAHLGEEVLWWVAVEVPSSEVRVDSPAVDEVPNNSILIVMLTYVNLDFFFSCVHKVKCKIE